VQFLYSAGVETHYQVGRVRFENENIKKPTARPVLLF
jgi:hypothetical protein